MVLQRSSCKDILRGLNRNQWDKTDILLNHISPCFPSAKWETQATRSALLLAQIQTKVCKNNNTNNCIKMLSTWGSNCRKIWARRKQMHKQKLELCSFHMYKQMAMANANAIHIQIDNACINIHIILSNAILHICTYRYACINIYYYPLNYLFIIQIFNGYLPPTYYILVYVFYFDY